MWETLNETGTTIPRILRVGLPDRYVTHGKPALLHEEVGFTGERIAERVAGGDPSTATPRPWARRATRCSNETTRRGSGPFRGGGMLLCFGSFIMMPRREGLCVRLITEPDEAAGRDASAGAKRLRLPRSDEQAAS